MTNHLRLVHSVPSDQSFVCLECGFPAPTRQGLESHWADEQHSPEQVQKQRLAASRKNEGWLLNRDE